VGNAPPPRAAVSRILRTPLLHRCQYPIIVCAATAADPSINSSIGRAAINYPDKDPLARPVRRGTPVRCFQTDVPYIESSLSVLALTASPPTSNIQSSDFCDLFSGISHLRCQLLPYSGTTANHLMRQRRLIPLPNDFYSTICITHSTQPWTQPHVSSPLLPPGMVDIGVPEL
jgi:hypothetical protein